MTAQDLPAAAAAKPARLPGSWHLPLLLFGLALAALLWQLWLPLNHDTQWYLDATGRLLDGARLYRDVIEVNPPLAFYLTVPPVFLARLIGLPADLVFTLYVLALAGLSLRLTAGLLGAAPTLKASLGGPLLVGLGLALFIAPLRDFGQREHLMLILATPYLVLAALRAEGCRPALGAALAAGLAAGLGLSLKPYFLLLPLVVELVLLAWRREGLIRGLFRPETWALGLTVLAYVVSIPLLTPDYLSTILPFALAVYDEAYRNPWSLVAARGLLPSLGLLLAVLYASGLPPERPGSRLLRLLPFAAAALLAVYFYQHKAWTYQSYPAFALLVAWLPPALAVWWRDGGPAKAAKTVWRLRGLALACLALLLLTEAVGARARNHYIMGDWVEPYLAGNVEPGDAVYVFSTNVPAAYPWIAEAGLVSASRYPARWLLPGLMLKRAAGEGDPVLLARIETFVRDSLVEDFERQPPALVLVDRRQEKSYFGGLAFDYLAQAREDPRFAALWRHYERLGSLPEGGPPIYEVWRRKPE